MVIKNGSDFSKKLMDRRLVDKWFMLNNVEMDSITLILNELTVNTYGKFLPDIYTFSTLAARTVYRPLFWCLAPSFFKQGL